MVRHINIRRVIAVQLTSPKENPLVTDESRLMDVWFDGAAVRKQMFKKVKKAEQEGFVRDLLAQGFVQAGNLLFDPRAILYAEMENELLGGIVTVGFGENGKPVELKVGSRDFLALTAALAALPRERSGVEGS
jgi:hypothetical protein